MSARRGSSRSVGATKQCAVYVRGGLRCTWCQRRLRAARTDGGKDTVTATIDHLNGDGYDHRAENLVPACRPCNSLRGWAEAWTVHLGGHGQTAAAGYKRAAEQTAEPLDYAAGSALAKRWHPGRLEQIRKCQRRWCERRAGRLPAVTEFMTAEVAA